MKKQVSRKDIAKRAGTSVSVVSRALNNSGYVAKEKRDLILQLAKEMNYIFTSSTGYMGEKRTKKILFYCDDLSNPFYVELYYGMMGAAKERGYTILIDGKVSFDDVKNTLVDGIITSNQGIAQNYIEQVGKNYYLPVVSASYCDNITIQKSLPIVEVDMFKVVEMAMEYLYKYGHKKVAMGMPYQLDKKNSRTLAYLNWVKDKGEKNPEKYYIGIYKHSPDLMKDSVKSIHISVMGIDGISNRKYISPLLTTIDIHPKLQGAKCVEVLLDIIEEKKYKHVNRSRIQLLEGESVSKRKS